MPEAKKDAFVVGTQPALHLQQWVSMPFNFGNGDFEGPGDAVFVAKPHYSGSGGIVVIKGLIPDCGDTYMGTRYAMPVSSRPY